MCPALQNKPRLPTPDFSADAPSADQQEKKRHDPFAPPYNPNLLLGEVRDEAEGNEYVILVSTSCFAVAVAVRVREGYELTKEIRSFS